MAVHNRKRCLNHDFYLPATCNFFVFSAHHKCDSPWVGGGKRHLDSYVNNVGLDRQEATQVDTSLTWQTERHWCDKNLELKKRELGEGSAPHLLTSDGESVSHVYVYSIPRPSQALVTNLLLRN